MIVKLDNKSGVKLKTYKKYCNEDIEIMPILREKQVLRNGKYIAPSGCVGFDEIEINVDYIDEEIKGEGEFWVRFIDFKGNIIEQLRADTGTFVPFPTPPVIDGYTFSGWACNVPFEDGGIVVNDNNVYCGALYITSDEKTRIYLNITDENMLTFELCYYQNQAGGVEVDFGDGSQTTRQESVGAQVIEHTFPSVGRYVVTLDFNEGVLGFLGTNAASKGMLGSLNGSHLDYQKFITKVEIGRGVNFIGAYAFAHCVNLQQINLPDGVKVEESSFENCHSLECLIIPNNTLKNTPKNLLSKCYNLKHLVIPYNYVKINNYFSDYCVNLKRIALPYLLTEIGEHAFSHCNGIREVIMPDSF